MRRAKTFKRQNGLAGLIYISPWILGFIVFLLGPIVYTFFISLHKWDMLSPMKYVGLQNYIKLFFQDKVFIQSLYVTFRFVFTSVILTMTLSLLIAVLLNRNSKIMYFFRTVFYVPSVISGIAMAILWAWVFNADFGIINYALYLLGVKGPNWLGDPAYAPWAFVIIMVTTFIGAPMIIFIAGLQNIPSYLYEAAEIDGANGVQKFLKITLPTLSPVILFNAITMVIGAFRTFTQAYVISGRTGYPAKSLLFYVVYLYDKAFHMLEMGTASAMAWIFILIVLIFTFILLKTSRKWVHYDNEGR